MADAMVTARMTQQKKEAGNRVLKELESNPSQAINGLYDYLIREKRLPFKQEEEFGWQKYTPEQIAEAKAFVASLVIPVDPEFRNMTTKEAKRRRLVEKGLLSEGTSR